MYWCQGVFNAEIASSLKAYSGGGGGLRDPPITMEKKRKEKKNYTKFKLLAVKNR